MSSFAMHIGTRDVVAVAVALTTIYLLKRRQRKLPPGPPAGLFGNRSQISPGEPWKTFSAWSKKFGPVISVYFGWRPVVVVNSAKDAYEILDKRGDIYSSRPVLVMGQMVLAGNMRGLAMQYGERWKRWRKLQHAGMGRGKAAQSYRQFQALETCILLNEIMQNPDAYGPIIKRFGTSVAFAISYGTRIRSLDEKVVVENTNAMKAFSETQVPGRYLADSWPILLRLPKCLQWFRGELDKRRLLDIDLYVNCFRDVQRRMAEGIAKESMSSRMLTLSAAGEAEGASEVEMAYAACSPFSAGIDTVSGSLETFLLAMLHNPACAKKAQAEIDAAVGRARMPDFGDEPAMPYVCAIVKEVLRWRPIAPTGIPHSLTQDDYYGGYFIPKGTTVYANIAAICQDPELFPDAEAFRPERFLKTKDPRLVDFDIPFGFGRRICPGQYVAVQSMFIVISRILWAFNIATGTDERGAALAPPDSSAYTPGLVRKPKPFHLELTARSEDVRRLIPIAAGDAEVELEGWN
ncbi:hypothetical protein M0805_006558 [Coniferiporia weirii]|nr:hypothetical protein M0805_006558 [Coniferiporia weirii]